MTTPKMLCLFCVAGLTMCLPALAALPEKEPGAAPGAWVSSSNAGASKALNRGVPRRAAPTAGFASSASEDVGLARNSARACADCASPHSDLGFIGTTWFGYSRAATLSGGKWYARFSGVAGTNYHWDLCSDIPGAGEANFDVDIKIVDSNCNIVAGLDGSCSTSGDYQPNDFTWTCAADGTYYVVLAPYPGYGGDVCTGTENDTFTLYYYSEYDACALNQPPNDDCAAVVPRPLAAGVPATISGDSTCSTPDGVCFAGTGVGEAWEAFVLTGSPAGWSVKLDYCGMFPVFGSAWRKLATDCPCPISSLWSTVAHGTGECGDGNITMYWQGLPDGTYWYPVKWDPEHTTGGPYTMHVLATPIAPAWCAASGGCGSGIGRVVVGSIDQSSGCANYVDNGALSTELYSGGSQQITVTNSNPHANDRCRAWVDWNQDFDFDDSGESITMSGSPGPGPYTAVMVPPTGVTQGPKRLRVRIAPPGDLSPCGSVSAGEVEDYTIIVRPGTPGGPTGQCCFEPSPSCADGVTELECTNTYLGKWKEGEDCSTLCDEEVGETCRLATEVAATPYVVAFNTKHFDYDPSPPGASCDPFGPTETVQNDAWIRWTAPANCTATATVTPTSYNVVMVVREGPDCNNLTEVACKSRLTFVGNIETVTFGAVAGTTYWFQVGQTGTTPDFGGGPTRFELDTDCSTATRACCSPVDGVCRDLSPLSCYQSGGSDQGIGTDCGSSVCPAALPGNFCASAVVISEGLTPFDTTSATTDGPIEAECFAYHGYMFNDVWYKVVPSCTGELTVTTCEGLGGTSSYDTRLAIYDGGTCEDLQLLSCNDDDTENCPADPEWWHSTVATPVVAGRPVRIRLGSYYDFGSGPGALNVYCTEAAVGACCKETACAEDYELTCVTEGGSYVGDGTQCSSQDCNNNGAIDTCDIHSGVSPDCNGNGVPDECDIGAGGSHDYDLNGAPDECDPDCNTNSIPDACDLDCAAGDCAEHPLGCGASTDCQPDLVPDECQLATGQTANHVYQYDDGSHEDEIGYGAGAEIAWMNHYVVADAADGIISIALAWGSVANGKPCTVYVWSDPDGDGAPFDARVVASAETAVADASSDLFTTVLLVPAIRVGPPGTSFFAGASLVNSAGEHPVAQDKHMPAGKSWIAGDTSFNLDPDDLNAATSPPINIDSIAGLEGNWLLRAYGARAGADCNMNQIPDDCDIAGGAATDCNHNAVPDSCDTILDCNRNGIFDACDIATGSSPDCQSNGVPDECDLLGGGDCQGDRIPDECQLGGNPTILPMIESFEDAVPPEGWSEQIQNTGHNWKRIAGIPTVDGLSMADCEYDPALVWQDEWLLTPELAIRGNVAISGHTLGSITYRDNYDVELWVVIGANAGDGDDILVAQLDPLWIADFQWAYFEYVLSAPATPFRVGFRYVGSNGAQAGLDLVAINGSMVPPPHDCNLNQLPDGCDIAEGVLHDADGNGIPDECVPLPDSDGDGDVDLADWAVLSECLAGPGELPAPSSPMTFHQCREHFDSDLDDDVDLVDFAAFMNRFSD